MLPPKGRFQKDWKMTCPCGDTLKNAECRTIYADGKKARIVCDLPTSKTKTHP